jgi:hypothetical protein
VRAPASRVLHLCVAFLLRPALARSSIADLRRFACRMAFQASSSSVRNPASIAVQGERSEIWMTLIQTRHGPDRTCAIRGGALGVSAHRAVAAREDHKRRWREPSPIRACWRLDTGLGTAQIRLMGQGRGCGRFQATSRPLYYCAIRPRAFSARAGHACPKTRCDTINGSGRIACTRRTVIARVRSRRPSSTSTTTRASRDGMTRGRRNSNIRSSCR